MSDSIVIGLHNRYRYATLFRMRVHWGSLPDGVVLVIGLAGLPKGTGRVDRAAAKLLPATIDGGCGRQVALDPTHIYRPMPDKDRCSDLPEILIPAAQSVFAAIRIQTPATLPPGPPPQFDVMQLEDGRVIGGCTIQITAPLA